MAEKIPRSRLLAGCGPGARGGALLRRSPPAPAAPPSRGRRGPRASAPRSGDPCPWPVPRRRRARAEPPFRALGTGALGSAPGRVGRREGARRVPRSRGGRRSESGAHVPVPGSTAAGSVNTCGREKERRSEGGARTDRRGPKVRRACRRSPGTQTNDPGWGAPGASTYRQVQAEGAEYIAGRGGGGGS